MQVVISEVNRSSYVTTDDGRILAAGLSKETATKFAAVNGLLRAAEDVIASQKAGEDVSGAIADLSVQVKRATYERG